MSSAINTLQQHPRETTRTRQMLNLKGKKRDVTIIDVIVYVLTRFLTDPSIAEMVFKENLLDGLAQSTGFAVDQVLQYFIDYF
jgi:hypothetical protein